MKSIPKIQQVLHNELAIKLKEIGIVHLNTDGLRSGGKLIEIKGKDLINFSSCSYLGLETDARLKQAAIDAIHRFGVHLSSSRAYVSVNLYEELESNLSKIFGYPTVAFASTTLAHMSLLPMYIGNNDAVILDHQVHSSIKTNIKSTGIPPQNISVIRHNRLDYLEDRIKKMSQFHSKVWYLADGVYSMYGDIAPLTDLMYLLEKYDNFYLYIDDAHGMSWEGENGCGHVLSQIALNPKVRMVTSLGKGFGTGGAAAVCHDESLQTLVRNYSGSLIFAGPLEPATLGAAVASSRIHLTEEIYQKQKELKSKVDFLYKLAKLKGLPMVNDGNTPIFYFGMGKLEVGFKMVEILIKKGFLPNIAIYPSVPYNNPGLRLMVNLHHDYSDLEQLIEVIASNLPDVLHSENFSIEKIEKGFGRRVGSLFTEL